MAFKTVACSLLGVPLIDVFLQPTARIPSMFCLELWTQKISLLPLSATGSVTGSHRPEAVPRGDGLEVSTKPGTIQALRFEC